MLYHFQNDDASVGLMEMRFHIPASELAGDVDPVDAFHQQVSLHWKGALRYWIISSSLALFCEGIGSNTVAKCSAKRSLVSFELLAQVPFVFQIGGNCMFRRLYFLLAFQIE